MRGDYETWTENPNHNYKMKKKYYEGKKKYYNPETGKDYFYQSNSLSLEIPDFELEVFKKRIEVEFWSPTQ